MQPGGRTVGHALLGPRPCGGQEGVLQAVLGHVEAAQPGDEQGEQARPVVPVRLLDRVARVQLPLPGSRIGTTGRTSTMPSGSALASAIASSRSAASIR